MIGPTPFAYSEVIQLDVLSLALIGNASGRTCGEGGRLGPRRFR